MPEKSVIDGAYLSLSMRGKLCLGNSEKKCFKEKEMIKANRKFYVRILKYGKHFHISDAKKLLDIWDS